MMMTGPEGTWAQQPVESGFGNESIEVLVRESFVGFGDQVLEISDLCLRSSFRKWWIGLLWDVLQMAVQIP